VLTEQNKYTIECGLQIPVNVYHCYESTLK